MSFFIFPNLCLYDTTTTPIHLFYRFPKNKQIAVRNGRQHCDTGAVPRGTVAGRPSREIAPAIRFRRHISPFPSDAKPILLQFPVLQIPFPRNRCSKIQELIIPSSNTLLPTRREDHSTSHLSRPCFSLRRRRLHSPHIRPIRRRFRPPNR